MSAQDKTDTTKYDVEILTLMESLPFSRDSGIGTREVRQAFPTLFQLDKSAGKTVAKRLSRLKDYSWRAYTDIIARTNEKRGSRIKVSAYAKKQLEKENNKNYNLIPKSLRASRMQHDHLEDQSLSSTEESYSTAEESSEEDLSDDDDPDEGLAEHFLGMDLSGLPAGCSRSKASPMRKKKHSNKSSKGALSKFQIEHGDGSNAAPFRIFASKNQHAFLGIAIGCEEDADFANGTQLMPCVSIVTEVNAADRTTRAAYLMGAQDDDSVGSKVMNVPNSLKSRTIIYEYQANEDHLFQLLPRLIVEDNESCRVHKQIARNLSKIAINTEGKKMYYAIHFPEVGTGFLSTHESIDPRTFKIQPTTHKIWKEVKMFNRDGTHQMDSDGNRAKGWVFLPALQWVVYEKGHGFRSPNKADHLSDDEFA